MLDELVRSGEGRDSKALLYQADVYQRPLEEQVQKAQAVQAQSLVLDEYPVFLPQANDSFGGGGGLFCSFGDAAQEEADPAFPVAVLPNGHEAVVVLGLAALYVVAEVEQRPVEDAPVNELEGDEEPANATVAV